MNEEWLTINFTLPKEPSRVRVSVWRKLKRSGAVNLGSSIWVLPVNEEHFDIFKEIATEVKENSGQAFISKTNFILNATDKPITDYFNNARDEEYKEFLGKCADFKAEIKKETGINNFTFAEIEENEHELAKLNTWLEGIKRRDFFHSALKDEAESEFVQCQKILASYCNTAYEKNGAL